MADRVTHKMKVEAGKGDPVLVTVCGTPAAPSDQPPSRRLCAHCVRSLRARGQIPVLNDWSTTLRPVIPRSPYDDPAWRQLALVGKVEDHPSRPDGHEVLTSSVVAWPGRYVLTRSRVYYLREPKADFVAWLEREGTPFDPEHPIRLKAEPVEG